MERKVSHRKRAWTPAEDEALESGVRQYGYNWGQIKKQYGRQGSGVLSNRENGMSLRDRSYTLRCQRLKKGVDLGAFREPIPGKNDPTADVVVEGPERHEEVNDGQATAEIAEVAVAVEEEKIETDEQHDGEASMVDVEAVIDGDDDDESAAAAATDEEVEQVTIEERLDDIPPPRKKARPFTEAEDDVLLELVRRFGRKWAMIKKERPDLFGDRIDCSIRQRVDTLAKNNGKDKRQKVTKNEGDQSTPKETKERVETDGGDVKTVACDKAIVSWSQEEDEALLHGIREVGYKWAEIKSREAGLGARSQVAIRKRAVVLRRNMVKRGEILKELEPPIDNEIVYPDSWEKISVTCRCGRRHSQRDLLLKGIDCSCGKDLAREIKQQYPWVVYIERKKSCADDDFTDVMYVGVSSQNLNERLKDHRCKRDLSESKFSVSLTMGETDMITVLKPKHNVCQEGGAKYSNLARVLKDDGFYGEVHRDGLQFRYSHVFDGHVKRTSTDFIQHLEVCGNLDGYARLAKIYNSCLLKNQDICVCERQCYVRRLHNRMVGRDEWYPFEEHEVKSFRKKDTHQYDDRVEWTEECLVKVVTSKRGLEESTKKTYARRISSMWQNGVLEEITEPQKVMDKLYERYGDSSVEACLSLIGMFLRYIKDVEFDKLFGRKKRHITYAYLDALDVIRVKLDAKRTSQMRTKREEDNWISLDELEAAMVTQKSKSKTMYDYQLYIWLLLQLKVSTLRNEFSTVKIKDYDVKEDNYLDMARKKVVLNNFKTKKSLGRQEIDIPEGVAEEIFEFAKKRLESGQGLLFCDRSGKAFDSSEFSEFVMSHMVKLTGKRVGSTMMRKIVVSHERSGEASILEKREASRVMLHSAWMNERYRRIF